MKILIILSVLVFSVPSFAVDEGTISKDIRDKRYSCLRASRSDVVKGTSKKEVKQVFKDFKSCLNKMKKLKGYGTMDKKQCKFFLGILKATIKDNYTEMYGTCSKLGTKELKKLCRQGFKNEYKRIKSWRNQCK